MWRAFDRAVQVGGHGLPLAMLGSGYAFFLSRPAGNPFFWTPAGFVLGAACLALPVLRMATGGMDWAEALLARQSDVLAVDLFLLIAGACLLRWRPAAVRRRRGEGSLVPGPAE